MTEEETREEQAAPDLEKELKECQDKYYRLLAESENLRKRLQKEKQDLIRHAISDVIVDFLGPIDHMETALKHANKMSDEIKHWATGFNMILGHFKDILANNGVQPFESAGAHFDPHHHEAVEVVHTDDHPAGVITEELAKGYRMGDRTIRPARVKVAKAVPPPPAEEEELSEQKEGEKHDQKEI